jgi:hypothetical protein
MLSTIEATQPIQLNKVYMNITGSSMLAPFHLVGQPGILLRTQKSDHKSHNLAIAYLPCIILRGRTYYISGAHVFFRRSGGDIFKHDSRVIVDWLLIKPKDIGLFDPAHRIIPGSL